MRFIEHMPLDAQHEWSRDAMVTADEMLALLSEHYTLDRSAAPGTNRLRPRISRCSTAPDRRVGGAARISRRDRVGDQAVLPDCDRLRLTADGQLRTCCSRRPRPDLRGALRAGAGDAELAELIAPPWPANSRARHRCGRLRGSRFGRCRRSAARSLGRRPRGDAERSRIVLAAALIASFGSVRATDG